MPKDKDSVVWGQEEEVTEVEDDEEGDEDEEEDEDEEGDEDEEEDEDEDEDSTQLQLEIDRLQHAVTDRDRKILALKKRINDIRGSRQQQPTMTTQASTSTAEPKKTVTSLALINPKTAKTVAISAAAGAAIAAIAAVGVWIYSKKRKTSTQTT